MQLEKHALAKKVEPSSKFLRLFYFLSGVVATIAYRIVIWLDPFWIQVSWYIGTIGFIIYFGHRTIVETKRANLVKNYNLVQAVRQSDIPEDEKEVLSYLTETSVTSKARFNSLFIFLASLLVLFINIGLYIYHLYF